MDVATGAVSPQKLYGVPVGLMYFEGAPRLLDSPATIPHLKDGDPERIIVEAYPGIVVRNLLGRKTVSYKNDTSAKQTDAHLATRRQIIDRLTAPANPYGLVAAGVDALPTIRQVTGWTPFCVRFRRLGHGSIVIQAMVLLLTLILWKDGSQIRR